jgi:hypothetical protein
MNEGNELPMPRWGRSVQANGLVTQWVGPAPLVTVAAGLLPGVGWVLVDRHSPAPGGWQEMLLPLTPAQLLRPSKATVRALTFDLLLSTDEFLALVPQWDQRHRGHWGGRAWQLRRRPRADVRLDDERPGPRAAKYHAHGLVLGIDLPAAHDRCLLETLDEPAMDAALARIDNAR